MSRKLAAIFALAVALAVPTVATSKNAVSTSTAVAVLPVEASTAGAQHAEPAGPNGGPGMFSLIAIGWLLRRCRHAGV
jgi:hypothetical protein